MTTDCGLAGVYVAAEDDINGLFLCFVLSDDDLLLFWLGGLVGALGSSASTILSGSCVTSFVVLPFLVFYNFCIYFINLEESAGDFIEPPKKWLCNVMFTLKLKLSIFFYYLL